MQIGSLVRKRENLKNPSTEYQILSIKFSPVFSHFISPENDCRSKILEFCVLIPFQTIGSLIPEINNLRSVGNFVVLVILFLIDFLDIVRGGF